MQDSKIMSLEGIELFKQLIRVYMPKTQIKDLAPLLSLKNLKEVVLDEELRSEAEKTFKESRVIIIYK